MNESCERLEIKYTCSDTFDCCDCGGNECGCRYCSSCNACDACKQERESA